MNCSGAMSWASWSVCVERGTAAAACIIGRCFLLSGGGAPPLARTSTASRFLDECFFVDACLAFFFLSWRCFDEWRCLRSDSLLLLLSEDSEDESEDG
jgi:hypothetical protein